MTRKPTSPSATPTSKPKHHAPNPQLQPSTRTKASTSRTASSRARRAPPAPTLRARLSATRSPPPPLARRKPPSWSALPAQTARTPASLRPAWSPASSAKRDPRTGASSTGAPDTSWPATPAPRNLKSATNSALCAGSPSSPSFSPTSAEGTTLLDVCV